MRAVEKARDWQTQTSVIRATERIRRLRERVARSEPSVCSERAVLVTESYKETEGQPMPIRRAKALDRVLRNMTVFIAPDELIVGNHASKPRSAPVFPEMGVDWLSRELDSILETRSQDRMVVPPKVKEDLRSIIPYWRGKTLREAVYAALPKEVINARLAKVFTLDNHEEGGLGHMLPDYPTVLAKGFNGIVDEVEERIGCLDLTRPDDYEKYIFYEAVKIVCRAACAFAERFADEAQRLAETERDLQRKDELLRIAQVCRRVPAQPAGSFYEAIQACWFVQLIIQIETNGTAISPGRMDQILYPYYARDVKENKLTPEQAQELIDCFWIKLNEIIKLRSEPATHVHAGFPTTQNVTIGGQTEEGLDATNELSFMFLTAQDHIRLSQPQFSLRVHRDTPSALLLRAAEVIRKGGGIPQLISDEVLIPSLLARGIPLETARNYAPIGCVELGVYELWGRGNGGYFNIPKVLELALNDGVDRMTGQQIGKKTGDPRQFTSFDDVMRAFREQMEYCTYLLAIENNVIDKVHAELMPHVFISTVSRGCIEQGKDVTRGGARYNWTGPIGVGIANAGDSLAAIKKVVFEEGKASMAELIEALDHDWENHESLRQLMRHAPKYGNDDDYADLLVKEVVNIFLDSLKRYPTPRGGDQGAAALFSLSVSLPFGWATGATPDGRKAGTPLADGVSPVHGVDVKGPTAVLKSVSKIEHIRTNGTILNIKFHPCALQGERQLQKFCDLIKTYLVDLKGSHVQVNVVSADTLRDAQRHPEQYRDLVIRVTGYSAFFTELSREVQDDIIERTEHMLM